MIEKFSRSMRQVSSRSNIKFIEGTRKTGPLNMQKDSVNPGLSKKGTSESGLRGHREGDETSSQMVQYSTPTVWGLYRL